MLSMLVLDTNHPDYVDTLILADPKHWPSYSESATAADQSDDRGALLAFGGRDSGQPFGGVWGSGAPTGKLFL